MPVCIVFGMVLCRRLETDLVKRLRRGLPEQWQAGDVCCEADSASDLVLVVRRIGDRSDRLLRALLAQPVEDEMVGALIAVAFIPLMSARCRGNGDRLDDLIAELVLVVGEVQRDGIPETRRHLGYLLLDRAWDRQRARFRRTDLSCSIDPVSLDRTLATSAAGPEQLALNRVALFEFRDRLVDPETGDPADVRSWNSALELWQRDRTTSADRDRWKYVRNRLRQLAPPDLVA